MSEVLAEVFKLDLATLADDARADLIRASEQLVNADIESSSKKIRQGRRDKREYWPAQPDTPLALAGWLRAS
jgi:hypothetical protein